MRDKPKLHGMAHLVQTLLAAVNFPIRLSQPEKLPIGSSSIPSYQLAGRVGDAYTTRSPTKRRASCCHFRALPKGSGPRKPSIVHCICTAPRR